MTRTTCPALLRSLWLTGTLTAVALVATPTLHGQDGERALLNQISAPARSVASYVPDIPVNGEGALLGRFSPDFIVKAGFELLAWDSPTQLIDGAQALMGRRTTTEARRPSVSTSQ